MGVNDFANDDMMITLLDGGCYTALIAPGASIRRGAPVVPLRNGCPLILPSLTSAGL